MLSNLHNSKICTFSENLHIFSKICTFFCTFWSIFEQMVFRRQKTTESRVETILEFPSVRRAPDLRLFMFGILWKAAEASNGRKSRICTFLEICTFFVKSAHFLKSAHFFGFYGGGRESLWKRRAGDSTVGVHH